MFVFMLVFVQCLDDLDGFHNMFSFSNSGDIVVDSCCQVQWPVNLDGIFSFLQIFTFDIDGLGRKV